MQVRSCIVVGLALYGITASAMPEGRNFNTDTVGFGGAREALIQNVQSVESAFTSARNMGGVPVTGSDYCTAWGGRECDGESKAPADIPQEEPAVSNRGTVDGAGGTVYAADSLVSGFESSLTDMDGNGSEAAQAEAVMDFFTLKSLDFTFRYDEPSPGGSAFEQPPVLTEDMKSVRLDSVEAGHGGFNIMANLMFTRVPESASLVLIILGLLGLKMSRRAFR